MKVKGDFRFLDIQKRGRSHLTTPHLFIDLEIEKNELNHLVKYANDTTILVKVCKSNKQCSKDIVDQNFPWSTINQMPCNKTKSHELVAKKKNKADTLPVNGLKQVNKLKIQGVTFQENNRFNEHVKQNLIDTYLFSVFYARKCSTKNYIWSIGLRRVSV